MYIKNKILSHLAVVEDTIRAGIPSRKKAVDVRKYRNLVMTNAGHLKVWTKAFQKAIHDNEVIYIPFSVKPYYIDDTIVIPSNRTIYAHKNAVIRQTKGTKVLMLRNAHTMDGSHHMPNAQKRDHNINIIGGRWEESYKARLGYGKSGMYDVNRSYYGVSTCMLFNNIENFALYNASFAHTAGFSVQVGEIKNAVFENIKFQKCYADGLHLTGNTENIVIRNIKGNVGDDLVALNMYDWQNSSVNFGPMKNVLCEKINLSSFAPYKAMRIQPGTYYFDDGTSVDCSINNLIVKDVKGINAFKMYYQTPPYKIGTAPEKGNVGSGNNVFFEHIQLKLKKPNDSMPVYIHSDKIRGSFGAFEIGANIKNIHFESINAKLYTKKYPLSGLISVGPKSAPLSENKEIFDPYLSSKVDTIHYKNIKINGKKVHDLKQFVRISNFDDVNQDGHSTAKGEVVNFVRE